MIPRQQHYHHCMAVLTFFAIVYYNLAPFVSVSCWWPMKHVEYLLENGQPVLFDPFAVQDGKILAIYPDLFPGLLFLWIYQHWSFLGLNVLRVFVFASFIVVLIYAVRKNRSDFSILLQINLLAFLMAGGIILQPDLFNYLLFTTCIYLLDGAFSSTWTRIWQSLQDMEA